MKNYHLLLSLFQMRLDQKQSDKTELWINVKAQYSQHNKLKNNVVENQIVLFCNWTPRFVHHSPAWFLFNAIHLIRLLEGVWFHKNEKFRIPRIKWNCFVHL